MRVLVLVDGLHSAEVLDAIAGIVRLEEAELLLAYVPFVGPRSGLDILSRRPGRRPPPPHRRAELLQAEDSSAEEAIAEALTLAGRYTTSVETVRIAGEPGRAVCRLAEQRNVDLVAVRVSGPDRPPLGPGSLGPVARFITDHCPSPVLLLRPRSRS